MTTLFCMKQEFFYCQTKDKTYFYKTKIGMPVITTEWDKLLNEMVFSLIQLNEQFNCLVCFQ